MDFPHPPLKLNTGDQWPLHLHDRKVIGLDINPAFCCAAQAKHSFSSGISTEIYGFCDFDTDEEYQQIPTVLALDPEDPSRGWIGHEARRYAAEYGCPLYENFLMIPDERADIPYGNDSSHPSYRRLMDIFLYELLANFLSGIIFLSLPDDANWRRNRGFFEDLLAEVSQRWNKDNPEPDFFTQFFLLDRSSAFEGSRLHNPRQSPENPFALCKGLAICGCLLQQREIILDNTVTMLQEAFPWAWARFRDILYMDMRKLLWDRLDGALSYWSKKENSALSFRALLKGLTADADTIAARHAEQIEDSVRRSTLLIVEGIPTIGSDPMDDPGSFSGFPPTYLGPKAYYPNQLHYALRSRVRFNFVDDLPWVNWDALEDLYYGPFLPPADFCQAIEPFIAEFRSYIPSESVMLGPVYSKALALTGQLDSMNLSPDTKKIIYKSTVDRTEQIHKDMQWKMYLDEARWDLLSRRFFQAIYDRQAEVLDQCMSFITTPDSPELPEEGVLN